MSVEIPLSAPDITAAECEAVLRVLSSGRLCQGPELEAFEAELAAYHSVEDAVAVSSGTAGLHLALLALGIGKGDAVIVPSFTFIAVANAVAYVGATPIFADIDPLTLNLDLDAVENAITPDTRAILMVHTFGVPAEMDALAEICRRHSLALVEDASEAIGAEFARRRVGGFGDLAVLGFYPNKQMTTSEGGAVLARDRNLAARLRRLRNQGRDAGAGWLDTVEIGCNYRISELACALGRVQLRRLEEMLTMRRTAAERYDKLLADFPGLERPPLALPRRIISWFCYVVRLPEEIGAERVQEDLRRAGIRTGRYFAPIHWQPAWRERGGRIGDSLRVTEKIAPRALALPFFNRIEGMQQERVAGHLRDAIEADIYRKDDRVRH